MYPNLQHSFENSVILVVEDDYDIGDILEKYIKNENMQVIRALDGQQALECLKANSIDLILLDIKLPKLNGWEILQIIRQTSHLPVIMLTALDDQVNKIMGLKMGADDFIFPRSRIFPRWNHCMRLPICNDLTALFCVISPICID